MEFTLELSPIQIMLAAKRAIGLKAFLENKFHNKEIDYLIESNIGDDEIKIISIDHEKGLTTIEVPDNSNDPYKKIIESNFKDFFIYDGSIPLLDLTAVILRDIRYEIKRIYFSEDNSPPRSNPEDFINPLIKIDRAGLLRLYFKSLGLTSIIDTLSSHIANLVYYVLLMINRKKSDKLNWENNIFGLFNLLSAPPSDMKRKIMEEIFDGLYASSSRHLLLVSFSDFTDNPQFLNVMEDYDAKTEGENSKDRERAAGLLKIAAEKLLNGVIHALNTQIPSEEFLLAPYISEFNDRIEEILDIFELGGSYELNRILSEYITYLHILNILKEIDAQIQIRRELLLKYLLYEISEYNPNTFREILYSKDIKFLREMVDRILKEYCNLR